MRGDAGSYTARCKGSPALGNVVSESHLRSLLFSPRLDVFSLCESPGVRTDGLSTLESSEFNEDVEGEFSFLFDNGFYVPDDGRTVTSLTAGVLVMGRHMAHPATAELIHNATDSLQNGVEHYLAHGEMPTAIKHAILNIYHSIELFLKARLSQAHPLLIYRSLTIQPSAPLTQKQMLILRREKKCRTILLDSVSVHLSGTKDSTSATSMRSSRPLTRRGL